MGSDKQAIGFVSFAYTAGVERRRLPGHPLHARNAKSGQYGGVRNFWMVTKGAPKGEAAKFIAWVTKPGNKTVRTIVNSQLDRDPLKHCRAGAPTQRPAGGHPREPTSAPSERSARWRSSSCVLIAAMVVTVFIKAWPSFSHNGLSWFGPGGDVDTQLRAMQQADAAARPLALLLPRLAADLGHDR